MPSSQDSADLYFENKPKSPIKLDCQDETTNESQRMLKL